jgi:hypothetical protein
MMLDNPDIKNFSHISPDFQAEQISSYRIALKVFDTGVVFLVLNDENRCLAFERIGFDKAPSVTGLTVRLQNVLYHHNFLRAGFWKEMHICLVSQQFQVVPDAYFHEEMASAYLQLNSLFDPSLATASVSTFSDLGIAYCFGVSNELKDWFTEIYPNTQCFFTHQGLCFLKALKTEMGTEALEQTLFVHADDGVANFVVFSESGKLKFYNSFTFQNAQDLLYFTLLVLEENNMQPAQTKLQYWGADTHDFPFESLAKEYIRSIAYGQRVGIIRFSFHFDELPEYSYFDLTGAFC